MHTGLHLSAVILPCKGKADEALISFRRFQASSSEGAGLKEGCTVLLGTASACCKCIPPPGTYCNCWRVNNRYSVLYSQKLWCTQNMELTTWLLFASTPLSSSFPGIFLCGWEYSPLLPLHVFLRCVAAFSSGLSAPPFSPCLSYSALSLLCH